MLAGPGRSTRKSSSLAADVAALELDRLLFDLAISNAALHWMPDQAAALRAIRGALARRPVPGRDGRQAQRPHRRRSAHRGCGRAGHPVPSIRKFFPSVGEESALLEEAKGSTCVPCGGSRVRRRLRPGQTPADWTKVFRSDVWREVPIEQHAELARSIDEACAGLRSADGWEHRPLAVAMGLPCDLSVRCCLDWDYSWRRGARHRTHPPRPVRRRSRVPLRGWPSRHRERLGWMTGSSGPRLGRPGRRTPGACAWGVSRGQGRSGRTALVAAAYGNHLGVARFLIDAGADERQG